MESKGARSWSLVFLCQSPETEWEREVQASPWEWEQPSGLYPNMSTGKESWLPGRDLNTCTSRPRRPSLSHLSHPSRHLSSQLPIKTLHLGCIPGDQSNFPLSGAVVLTEKDSC